MWLIFLGLLLLPAGTVQANSDSSQGLNEPYFVPAKDLPSAEDASHFEKPKVAPPPGRFDQVFVNPFNASTRLSSRFGKQGQGHAMFLDTFHGIRLISRFRNLPVGSYRVETDGAFHNGAVAICDEAAIREIAPEAPKRTWGILRTNPKGEAEIDTLFLGISRAGTYLVPTEAVDTKKDEFFRIKNKEFSLLGQWLTLRRISEKGEVAEKDTLCGKLETDYSRAWKVEPASGGKVWGLMLFPRDDDNRTRMKFVLRGGLPGTRYKLVIHEWEDCSDPAGGSMGPPYAPEKNKKISYPIYPWPIVEGNLGTYTANKEGIIAGKKIYNHPLTEGSPATIWGRSIVVYALPKGKSPLTSAPVPVGCGKITEGDLDPGF